MKNKWKELREAQEADIVNEEVDEIEEVEDEVDETESNAGVLVEGVKEAYEKKLRELADFFIGEKSDEEANELLSTMVSENSLSKDIISWRTQLLKSNTSCFLPLTRYSICALTQVEAILSVHLRVSGQIPSLNLFGNGLSLSRINQCHTAALETCAGETAPVDTRGFSHDLV
jgi:hypothetical protein